MVTGTFMVIRRVPKNRTASELNVTSVVYFYRTSMVLCIERLTPST